MTMSVDAQQRAAIVEAVKRVAREHLRAKNATDALSHYEPDAIVAGNAFLYPSFEQFAEDARDFYRTLQQIDLAVWDEMHVQVLGEDAAVLTATVRWSSTDTAGVRLDLKGAWTAVFVQRDGRWRICARHESFEPHAHQE
ncbi:MAG: SgcJ/EcaC family oxidoreductase [Gemmatimonadales bacterium]|nr:SgcJ/EcaC family oxidoreductase [Gemmatimonadales bacterium]